MTYKIQVKTTNQIYKIETEEALKTGQEVLVEAEQIIEPAVTLCPKILKNEESDLAMANFQRILSSEDEQNKTRLKKQAENYLSEAVAKVMRHNLDMKILDADLSFDEKKLTFYFSAENRVDFRSLVADMVGSFRKIIRLQQIGPRDETRLFGGYGRCGQELCCKRFLNNMEKINSDIAVVAETNGKNLQKMTGCCGRPMCCLSYELEDGGRRPILVDRKGDESITKEDKEVKK